MTFSIRTTTHDPGDLSGRDADLAQAIVAIFHYSNPAFSIRFQPRIETNGTPVAIFTRFLGNTPVYLERLFKQKANEQRNK